MEKWKTIKGFEGRYKISDYGRVWSIANAKIMSQVYNDRGYLHVPLRDKFGVRKHHRVNRLVAKEFVPNPEGLSEAHHINEIKADNRSKNLQWVSRGYNVEASKAKKYKLINPEGEHIEVFNLKKFCEERGMHCSNLIKVAFGKLPSYKGYKSIHTPKHYNSSYKKECTLRSPCGELVTENSQADFARKIGVRKTDIQRMLKGIRKHCKGWTLP